LGFFLLYGGIGLLILAGFCMSESPGAKKKFLRYFELMGRNSLFVFMLQYFVYFTVLSELNLGYSSLWPFIFVLSLVPVGVGAVFWDKKGWNRYLRVPFIHHARSLKTVSEKCSNLAVASREHSVHRSLVPHVVMRVKNARQETKK
jgi:hypothetical protein